MAYEFTKLADVPALEEVPEGANAFIEVEGEIKRVPGDGLGGGVVDFAPTWYGWLGENRTAPAGYAPRFYGDEATPIEYADFKKALDGGVARFRWNGGDMYGIGMSFDAYYAPIIDMCDENKFGYIAEWQSYLVFSDTDVEGLSPFPLLSDDEEEEASVAALSTDEAQTEELKPGAHVPPRGDS